MRILAIETATMLGGVALMDSREGLLAERRINVRSTHSESLMPELEAMLRLAGADLSELDAVAVSIGPGAFTGLRIGLSAAKGLCFSAGLRLVPVPTLEAMAYCLPFSDIPVCPMLDARKREVYAGLFSTRAQWPETLTDPAAQRAGDFAAGIEGHKRVIFLGQGALAYRDDINSSFSGEALFPPEHLMVPSPASVAAMGLRILHAGELPDPISLTPAYLRSSEAELKAE